jgi:hypothetical protein
MRLLRGDFRRGSNSLPRGVRGLVEATLSPSFGQRLGRANRQLQPGECNGTPGEVLWSGDWLPRQVIASPCLCLCSGVYYSMPASLPAASLTTGAPELGRADLTELRTVISIRPFPNGPGERACYSHLIEQLQATPDRSHKTKAEFDEYCRSRFHVTAASFAYCWREANKVTGTGWDRPGRRRR